MSEQCPALQLVPEHTSNIVAVANHWQWAGDLISSEFEPHAQTSCSRSSHHTTCAIWSISTPFFIRTEAHFWSKFKDKLRTFSALAEVQSRKFSILRTNICS